MAPATDAEEKAEAVLKEDSAEELDTGEESGETKEFDVTAEAKAAVKTKATAAAVFEGDYTEITDTTEG